VLVHEEDHNLSANGAMNEGYWSTLLGLPGIPPSSEEVMIARDLILADETEGSVHIQHVSTARSVDLIRLAKHRGVHVTAEAAPHHFTLTDEAVVGYHTHAKMNPPLRTERDRLAIIEGLLDGSIDAIATDHAPHTAHEKEKEFDLAPFGIIGLETLFPLAYEQLVLSGCMTLCQLARKMTSEPARILEIDKGTLSRGASADIVIVDLNKRQIYRKEDILSKSKNSPFIDREMVGWPVATLVDGRFIMKDRKIVV
jgi:dihydroorotase